MVLSRDAKCFVGQCVEIEFRDRRKRVHRQSCEIYDIGFLPSFGPCLITSLGEIRLDRVLSCKLLDIGEAKTA